MYRWLLLIIILFTVNAVALNFAVSKQGRVVGKVQSAYLRASDDYSSIGQRFDIGYYGLYEANHGVDPDNPVTGTYLIIPTRYIIPKELSYKKNNIVINLAEMRLYYYSKKMRRVFTFPIGIGKEGWKTPTGKFTIMQKIRHPVWLVPKSIQRYRKAHGAKVVKVIQSGPNNPMGDYALRLSNPAYLIHGTDDPVGIGRRSSAGCIRMYPSDIKKLFHMVSKGTLINIVDQPFKVARLKNKFLLEAHMPLYEDRKADADLYVTSLQAIVKYAQLQKYTLNKNDALQLAHEHIGMPQVITSSRVKAKVPSVVRIY
ncbi:MAG: L,D-transpeptidase family protein [Gammaproteobacteria bacterium]|nr:L,D-transpeptidase family protein [Gammaproteobacteria bacterium]